MVETGFWEFGWIANGSPVSEGHSLLAPTLIATSSVVFAETCARHCFVQLQDCRQLLPYRIREGFLIIRQQPWETVSLTHGAAQTSASRIKRYRT